MSIALEKGKVLIICGGDYGNTITCSSGGLLLASYVYGRSQIYIYRIVADDGYVTLTGGGWEQSSYLVIDEKTGIDPNVFTHQKTISNAIIGDIYIATVNSGNDGTMYDIGVSGADVIFDNQGFNSYTRMKILKATSSTIIITPEYDSPNNYSLGKLYL